MSCTIRHVLVIETGAILVSKALTLAFIHDRVDASTRLEADAAERRGRNGVRVVLITLRTQTLLRKKDAWWRRLFQGVQGGCTRRK